MDKFVVTTTNEGQTFWLRGTVWAFHFDRATQYDSREAAQAALDKAKKFMMPVIYRRAMIMPAFEEAAS
jgi:hypothetical protein